MIRICPLTQLDADDVTEFQLMDTEDRSRRVILIQYRGSIYAYENLCPHAWVPLNIAADYFLNYESTHLQCSNHFAQFRIEDGICTQGPCKGKSLNRFEVEIKEGWVHLHL